MTNFEWSKAICRIDEVAFAQWKKEHISDLDQRAFSTGRDNYTLGGNKAAARKTNEFAVQLRIEGAK